jgi:hypothetical protein
MLNILIGVVVVLIIAVVAVALGGRKRRSETSFEEPFATDPQPSVDEIASGKLPLIVPHKVSEADPTTPAA